MKLPTTAVCMKKILLAALLLVSTSNMAADKGVHGSGATSCGKFSNETTYQRSYDLMWVLGFVDAVNIRNLEGPDLMKGIDGDAALGFISNYCQNNPLDHLFNAASALVNELKARNGK